MPFKIIPDRFSTLKIFILIFLFFSFLLRCIFLIWNFNEVDTSFFTLANTFIIGLFFDLGTATFFAVPYAIYLLITPKKFYGSTLDKLITYLAFSISLIVLIFSFFAEITFWEEFSRRFNFIAVDYLIYTNEVVKNINESYPIPLLITGILIILFLLIYYTYKKGVFVKTFNNSNSFRQKLIPAILIICIALIFGFFLSNKNAEQFENRYNNEIAKTGIYSFFAAFKNNELPFNEFYKTIDKKTAYATVKKEILQNKDSLYNKNTESIYRKVINKDSLKNIEKPNVIFICIESLSARYMSYHNNEANITPTLDSLANNSLFFSNLYATGTRTIRGMEAITLSIPPTPGRSIVKRKNNQNLFTISEVFEQKGYESSFFYGGDGYFDNMNAFFGGNGFNIVDRGRGFLIDKNLKTKRTNINDDEVTFENAWGVCDGDIYNKVLKEADKSYDKGQPFFNFIMTTSNHRPFSYPDNKIDIPSGTGRYGAVKYTDFAIGEFLKNAQKKPWYNNTVFVIMSDHCARSAGKWELDVENYQIPAFIINAKQIAPQKIDKLCSQIDLFPTLFYILNWDYESNFFGKNILKMNKNDERALIGNYRKLGLLKANKLVVLNEQKEASFYEWDYKDNSLKNLPTEDKELLKETISYYQVAYDLYKNDGLKLK